MYVYLEEIGNKKMPKWGFIICNNPFFSHHVLLIFCLSFISLRFLNLFYNELIQFMFFKKEGYSVLLGPEVISSI